MRIGFVCTGRFGVAESGAHTMVGGPEGRGSPLRPTEKSAREGALPRFPLGCRLQSGLRGSDRSVLPARRKVRGVSSEPPYRLISRRVMGAELIVCTGTEAPSDRVLMERAFDVGPTGTIGPTLSATGPRFCRMPPVSWRAKTRRRTSPRMLASKPREFATTGHRAIW